MSATEAQLGLVCDFGILLGVAYEFVPVSLSSPVFPSSLLFSPVLSSPLLSCPVLTCSYPCVGTG